jgi:predicted phosphodiesterase
LNKFLVIIFIISSLVIVITIVSFAIRPPLLPPPPYVTPSEFNFAAAGDWGCGSNAEDTVKNIEDKNPELVLGLGDYSYEDSADCWLDIIQPINAKMKIAIGNHDTDQIGMLNKYMNHFGLSKQYYSFDYKNIHFIALSTEVSFNVNSAQHKFVENDLSKAASDPKTDWIIVYFHRPMYTLPSTHAAISSLRNTYHPLFEQYGVDLVLQGHNHNYQRTYPLRFNSEDNEDPIVANKDSSNYRSSDGQIFLTVGTGGTSLYSFTGKEDYFVKQHIGFGILNMDITNNGRTLTGKLYPNNNGNIIDQFTIYK